MVLVLSSQEGDRREGKKRSEWSLLRKTVCSAETNNIFKNIGEGSIVASGLGLVWELNRELNNSGN